MRNQIDCRNAESQPMSQEPRIFRFAPSPNGRLHLGHAYSALCNRDLARACDERDVFEVRWVEHKKPIERLMAQAEVSLGRLLDRVTSVAHR